MILILRGKCSRYLAGDRFGRVLQIRFAPRGVFRNSLDTDRFSL